MPRNKAGEGNAYIEERKPGLAERMQRLMQGEDVARRARVGSQSTLSPGGGIPGAYPSYVQSRMAGSAPRFARTTPVIQPTAEETRQRQAQTSTIAQRARTHPAQSSAPFNEGADLPAAFTQGVQQRMGQQGITASRPFGFEKADTGERVLGSYKHGGTVPRTGTYKLHRGEHVVPKNRWMQKASTSMKKKGTEGSFTRSAKRAGYGTQQYAHMKEHAPGLLGQRARMALRFAEARH